MCSIKLRLVPALKTGDSNYIYLVNRYSTILCILVVVQALTGCGDSKNTSDPPGTSLLVPTLAPQQIATGLSEAFEFAAQRIQPAVVNIAAVGSSSDEPASQQLPQDKLPHLFEADPKKSPHSNEEFTPDGLGTGVVIDLDGHIITNHHVVMRARSVAVKFHDKRTMQAEIIATEPKHDLAILQVKDADVLPAVFGDSDTLKIGQWVLAVGNPFGLEYTITAGIISARGRTLFGKDSLGDLIQTDAPINPGNSGGPLVNLKGEIVGINTAIFSRSGGHIGIGFAIPSNTVKEVIRRLLKQ